MKLIKNLGIIIIFIVLFSLNGYAEDKKSADNFMRTLLTTLEENLNTKRPMKEKLDFFLPFVEDKFDYTYMCRWSLGNYVRGVKGEQLNEYLRVCKDFMMLYYGDLFIKYYNDYKFIVVDSKSLDNDTFVVNVYVNPKRGGDKNQGSILNADWKLKYNQEQNKFFLIDLSLNNISVLSTQRNQIESIIKTNENNIDAMIQNLQEVYNKKMQELQ